MRDAQSISTFAFCTYEIQFDSYKKPKNVCSALKQKIK